MTQDIGAIGNVGFGRTVLLLPSCERGVEMIAREVEQVANDRIAPWARREVVVVGFGDPVDPTPQEDGACDREDEFGCHRGARFRPKRLVVGDQV